ncbi:DMT family transporter [Kangiella marina]|uniref:DMT family transporter n=1 Tax=Kangiella marina TaxID=1079178 RepID=A0ABP8ID19_9GAMM
MSLAFIETANIGLGELFSLASALTWATAVILFKQAGETLSATSLNLFKNILGASLLIPTALMVEGAVLPQLTGWEWSLVLVSGFIGIAVADTWYFQALKKVGAGNTAIVASLYSPFVVILSVIFLGEHLNLVQFAAFLLVLLGIFLVTYQKNRKHVDAVTFFQGLGFAMGAVLLNAIGIVMVKRIIEGDGFFWIITLRLLGGIVGTLLFLTLTQKLTTVIHDIKQPRDWRWLITASVLATYITMIFWLAGYKYTDASTASVLNETTNVFIVIFAWLFLKEELPRRKLLGIVFAFVGVVLFISY